MSSGGAPAAPDPGQTAAAQQQLNNSTSTWNANLGHVNQSGPLGNQTWSITGTNPDGSPQYSVNTTLNPNAQTNLNNQLAQGASLTGTAGNALTNQINATAGQGINTAGMQAIQGGLDGNQFNALAGSYINSAGEPVYSDGQGNILMGASLSPQSQSVGIPQVAAQTATGGAIQNSLQGAGDLQGQFNSAQKAALDQQMGYLQPQQQDTQNQLADSLRQQGITQESNPVAYQHAMDQLNRNNTFQNQQAFDSSYNTGLASANQLFNQSLQSGQFANDAQAQGFNQSATNAQMQNQVALANAGLGAQTGIANMNAANQVNMANSAAANQYQQYAAGLGQNNNQFNATAGNQMAQFNAGMNNANVNSLGNAYLNNAQLSNSANAQQFGQAVTQQQLPYQQMQQLYGLSGVQMPQFTNYGAGTSTPANYQGQVQQNYQNQLGTYNNDQSGMYSLAGAGLTAAAMMMF